MKRAVAMAVASVVAVLVLPGTASAEGGSQRFTLIFRDGESTVVAAGPIAGVGTVVEEEGGTELSFPVTFVFPDGSVSLIVSTVEESFDFDPVSCIVRFELVESYIITGGTGRYDGATGSGTFTGRAILVFPRDEHGNCLGPESDAAPLFSLSVLSGNGSVTIPRATAA